MHDVWGTLPTVDETGGPVDKPVWRGCQHRDPDPCHRPATVAVTLLDAMCDRWINLQVCREHAPRPGRIVVADWSDVCEDPDHLGLDVTVHHLDPD